MRLKLARLLFGALLPLLFPFALLAQTFAYVTNFYSNSVSVIDTSSNAVVATLPVRDGPSGVAITPDGTRAYVTDTVGGSVSVIDTSNSTVVTTIEVRAFPEAVAITPDGTHAYVVNSGSASVSVIDTSTNTVVATVPVEGEPFFVAITPDGTHAYVLNEFSDTSPIVDTSFGSVSVIAVPTNTVVATVSVEGRPVDLAITPDGTRAYVTSGRNSLSVIDTSSNAMLTTVAVGYDPGNVAITPDGTRAYVTIYPPDFSGTLSVIDTSSDTVLTTVAVGSYPYSVAFTPDGTRAYVANSYSRSVSVIDTSSNTVVDTVAVGGYPSGVAITPAVPFSAFSAKLDILAAKRAAPAGFDLMGAFTLGAGTMAVDPATQPLTLQVGSYRMTLPAGSFRARGKGTFSYTGSVSGVGLQLRIVPTGADAYQIQVHVSKVDLRELTNPVAVRLTIGNNAGTTSVTADFH